MERVDGPAAERHDESVPRRVITAIPLPPLWLAMAGLALLLSAWPVFVKHSGQQNRADELLRSAMSAAAHGKWDDAIAAAQQALVIRPDYRAAWDELRGLLAAKAAAHPTAEGYWREALDALQSNNYAGCIDLARRALKLWPRYPKALNVLSVCSLNVGNYDDAVGSARQAIEIEPTFQPARDNLTLALAQKAKGAIPPSAVQTTVDALLNSSVQNYRAGRMQACIDAARAALKLSPGSAVAYNNIAACSNDLGRPDDAIAAASQALRLQPDFQLARNNLTAALNLRSKQK
jgi:tetratricopeptide (TPR) repeat protein